MENFTTDEELLKDENYSADIDDEEDITDEDALEEISEEESEENNCNGDIRTAILMMNELKIYCEKKMIPMFSTIADVDEEKHTAKYITRTLTPFMARKNIVNDKQLYNCYTNAMVLAGRHKFESIAFPSISTGVYHFPVEKADYISLQAVKDYFSKHPESTLTVVKLVYYSYEDFEIMKNVARTYNSEMDLDIWVCENSSIFRL